jgi:hypothetical protein
LATQIDFPIGRGQVWNGHLLVRLVQILELFVEDDRLDVYAGELEVRPPGAPTTQARCDGSDGARRLINATRLIATVAQIKTLT